MPTSTSLSEQFAGSTQRQIETRLGRINVRIGGAGSGPTLVCWPNLMIDHTMWSYQYEHFSKSHPMVLIDSPGIGKSEPLRKLIDQRDCMECLVEVLDHLVIESCVLIGSTWGAMLATLCAVWIPERLAGIVAINVTCSAPSTFETVTMSNLASVLYLHDTVPPWWLEVVHNTFLPATSEHSDESFQEFLKIVLTEDPKSLSFGLQSIDLGRKDNVAVLQRTSRVPALIIAGAEDMIWPLREARRVADAIIGSTLVVLPGAGHMAARHKPALTNEAIAMFLQRLT